MFRNTVSPPKSTHQIKRGVIWIPIAFYIGIRYTDGKYRVRLLRGHTVFYKVLRRKKHVIDPKTVILINKKEGF
jgi:hypothetical protein